MVFFLKVSEKLMQKREMIKKNEDFEKIIKTGKLKKTKYYNIYYKDGGNTFPMFGLAVSKKLGTAVKRNKIKRQLRTIIDANKKRFKNTNNYIFAVFPFPDLYHSPCKQLIFLLHLLLYNNTL